MGFATKLKDVTKRAFGRAPAGLPDHTAAASAGGSAGTERKRKALYLIAEPGYPNFGDELIAREWLRYLASRCPDREVIVDCARPGPAAMILRGVHPHVEFTDTMRRLGTENPFPYDGPIDDIARFVAEALDDEGRAAQYAAGIRVLQRDVRSIHMLGGGYMRGDWTCNLSRLAIGPWARRHGIPVVGTGVGLMPISGDSLTFARNAVADFDRFTVRDESTLAALNDGGDSAAAPIAKLAPDDCFVNGLEDCYMPAEGLPDTMLCIQSDFIGDTEALHAHVIAVLDRWNVGVHDPIGVAECNPVIDRPIYDYLLAHGYDNVRFYPVAEILERGFPARTGQRWLSTRYHPHLLAAAIGCSGSYIAVDPQYYSVKHHAVLRMGSHWTAAPLGQPAPEPGTGFADPTRRFTYRDQIRTTVDALYNG
ncbi:ABC transporter substrate-binding protein [Bifidobacterium ramosum]|uniref:ABC transporter substrate-binding protein n=1 Tax=Bifidobacterium ramosum TaxID=1798158 RepID=A0A6L4X0X1_9BIFI|nr:polysaccharide pyruvyl transferase family protein [Bifidobacterium ramosum]KAB8288617.1 ABC transporter substrate-binding protein [Bifidobacterium ramosum]NEG72849.1 polysaccharide pyruvyl transferase family protein [Bifidobacterium ramosum]